MQHNWISVFPDPCRAQCQNVLISGFGHLSGLCLWRANNAAGGCFGSDAFTTTETCGGGRTRRINSSVDRAEFSSTAYKLQRRRLSSNSSLINKDGCHTFLLCESCVSCYREAGLTDFLISSYYQCAGSPPPPPRPGDLAYRQQVKQIGNDSVRFSPAAPSRTLVFLPHFSSNSLSKNLFPHFIVSICYFILFLCPCFMQFAMSSFSKSFSFLSSMFILYRTWKM